jgi:general secretion pathway protein G
MNKQRANFSAGFTIVELLIVIIVIAILATISIVAYNGVQERSRDSIRKQDLASLAKVTQLYAIDLGDNAQAGCGNGTGSGWLHSDYDGTGPYLPINTCLINSGNLQRAIRDPSGSNSCSGTSCHAYLKASCVSGTWYFANLETLPQDGTFTDDKCQSTWDTSYGVNYAVKVD